MRFYEILQECENVKALVHQNFLHFMKRYEKKIASLRTSRSGVRVPSGVPEKQLISVRNQLLFFLLRDVQMNNDGYFVDLWS